MTSWQARNVSRIQSDLRDFDRFLRDHLRADRIKGHFVKIAAQGGIRQRDRAFERIYRRVHELSFRRARACQKHPFSLPARLDKYIDYLSQKSIKTADQGQSVSMFLILCLI